MNVVVFGFTGQMNLAAAGLYHYRARAYDPALGRFPQADPDGYRDNSNLYAYVGNDPVNATDPTGRYGCLTYGATISDDASAVGCDSPTDINSFNRPPSILDRFIHRLEDDTITVTGQRPSGRGGGSYQGVNTPLFASREACRAYYLELQTGLQQSHVLNWTLGASGVGATIGGILGSVGPGGGTAILGGVGAVGGGWLGAAIGRLTAPTGIPESRCP